MNVFKWFGWRVSVRSLVMSSYKRGLARTKGRDPQGAMDDFTAAIEARDAPADVKAMALYNRALLFAAVHDIAKANDDLQAVLAMAAPLPEIKLAAKRRLERMRNRPIENAPAPPAQKASNKSL
ncbi:MAG: hypothetical protein WD669_02920 [Pirellulales bacterium]